MARYRLLETAYIHDRIYKQGEFVEVSDDLIPGEHMLPVDEPAKLKASQVGLVNGPLPNPIEEMTVVLPGQAPGQAQIKSGLEAPPVDQEF